MLTKLSDDETRISLGKRCRGGLISKHEGILAKIQKQDKYIPRASVNSQRSTAGLRNARALPAHSSVLRLVVGRPVIAPVRANQLDHVKSLTFV